MEVTVYLAAPWIKREEARSVRDQLVAAGFKVNSRWLGMPEQPPDYAEGKPSEGLSTRAKQDVEDVLAADVTLVLNLEKSEGKAVETGLAIAWGKLVIVVGKRTNIFHWFRDVVMTPDLLSAIAFINHWKRAKETNV
jgi:nucleoside 2-deoxyribosyltransferase